MIRAVIKGVPVIRTSVRDVPIVKADLGSKKIIVDNTKEEYSGEYLITPKAFKETVLPTTNKVMTEDVKVLEIPYYEVSNESGNTLFIG